MHSTTPTESGLLLSLSSLLPASSPLARRARRMADRLRADAPKAVHRAAAGLLADLLDATDAGLPLGAEDGLLDDDFDA